MRDSVRALLETCAYLLFPLIYSMLVVFLALYFGPALGGSTNFVIVGAIAPVVVLWVIVLRGREVRNADAQTQGFQTSPEKHTQALDDYLQLLEKNKREQTDE